MSTSGEIKLVTQAEMEAAVAAAISGAGGIIGAEPLIPTGIKTSAYTAAASDYIPVNISGGTVPITLPTAPADRTRIGLKIIAVSGTVGSTSMTVSTGGADVFNIAGGSVELTFSAKMQGVLMQYQASTKIWYLQTTDTPLNEALGAALLGTDGTVGGSSGSALSPSVVSSSQTLLSIANYGALEGEAHATVTTEAIEKAQTDALSKPGNCAVLFPAGEWFYNTTLVMKVPWVGAGRRRVKLKMVKEAFTYVEHIGGGGEAIVNANFALTYNAATAFVVDMENIDFYFQNATGSGYGEISGIRLANVAGGGGIDCRFFTEGTRNVTLLDFFACVQHTRWYTNDGTNTTESEHGGVFWVRNHTSAPASLANATEDNRFYECHAAGSTKDEVVSIFSGGGMTRGNRYIGGSITGLASSRTHAKLADIFPLSNGGALTYAAVENNYYVDVLLIDEEGTLASGGNVGTIGSGEDGANICQSNGFIRPRARVKSSLIANKIAVFRNVPGTYEGEYAGNIIDNPDITAVGSEQALETAIVGFDIIENPRVKGNIKYGCSFFLELIGGRVEATQRLFSDFGKVTGGNHIIPNTTGIAVNLESATLATAKMVGATITGGEKLYELHSTAIAQLDLDNNTHNTTAESGHYGNNGSSAGGTVRLRGNTLRGPAVLTRSGATLESSNNDFYGTLDGEKSASRLLFPSAVAVYKSVSEAGTETRTAVGEGTSRTFFVGSGLVLTSGTPVAVAIPMAAAVTIRGVAFFPSVLEGTPANRTHLWCAILNKNKEVVRVGLDYTSNTNTPCTVGEIHGLLLAEPYETKEEAVYYAVLCEVMSSTAALTLISREVKGSLAGVNPSLGASTAAGQTTPGAYTGLQTFTAATLIPWMCFV